MRLMGSFVSALVAGAGTGGGVGVLDFLTAAGAGAPSTSL